MERLARAVGMHKQHAHSARTKRRWEMDVMDSIPYIKVCRRKTGLGESKVSESEVSLEVEPNARGLLVPGLVALVSFAYHTIEGEGVRHRVPLRLHPGLMASSKNDGGLAILT